MRPEIVRFSTCERPFHVAMTCCQRIECPCADALFTFCEICGDTEPDANAVRFELRVDPLSWQEVQPPSRPPAVAKLVCEFMEDYPEREKEPLRRNALWKRTVAGRIHDHRLDRETVVTGTLVSFREIAFGPQASLLASFISEIEMEGVQYVVDDLYCPNPDCDCRQAHLVFVRCNPVSGPEPKLELKTSFLGTLSFAGRSHVTECQDCARDHAERLFGAWLSSNEWRVADLEWRYDKVKDIARRSLPKHSRDASPVERGSDYPANEPLRVGRNAPCPCGSGKKLKKCCGQKQVSGGEWSPLAAG